MKATHLSFSDRLLMQCDQMLRTLSGTAEDTQRPSPALHQAAPHLSTAQRRHIAGLMRVNHSGEVMAQALYYGQMATLHPNDPLYQHLHQAAREEGDHLRWCAEHLALLQSHPSRCAVLWYLGAFALGFIASQAGNSASLGFTAEVERQVMLHLEGHLQQLAMTDTQSTAIVQQMYADESEHRKQALAQGGVELPPLVTAGLRAVSRVMTRVAYYC